MKRLGAIFVAISMIAGIVISAPAKAAQQTLTIWATGGDSDAAVMAAAANAFELTNPNVKVNVESISWGEIGRAHV